ncbi:MAG: aryl-sulfate sulfotransferase [Ignavibacteriales bacterium]
MKTKYKFIILIVLACALSILIYDNVEKFKPISESQDILNKQLVLEEDFIGDTNYTVEDPKIIVNPYGISPLTALVIFETNDFTSPTVTIKGKDENTTYTNTFKTSNVHILPIYGLYANSNNEVIITVNEVDYKVNIKTDPLPNDIILPEYTKADKSNLNNELYFFTNTTNGYTVAYDINGDIRWYVTEPFNWDITRLNNGHLLLSSNRLINPPYYSIGLVEIDLLGKVYFEYTLPGGYHHDTYEMENGNLLVSTNNFEDNTVEDYIVEIDRKTGEIVKKINLKDILPIDQGLNQYAVAYDWFHNTSVWYDKKTNSITLSGRNQDAIVNINYDTLKIDWIIGDPSDWNKDMQKYFFKPTNNLEWPWASHAAMILPNGNLFVFDNGNNRSKKYEEYVKPENNYSRGVIYKYNTNNMTIEEVWSYGKTRGSDFYSPDLSDVDYLGKNHYLIHSGGHNKVDGYVSNVPAEDENAILSSTTVELLNDKVIFEIKFPTNYYHVEKLSLYANDEYQPGIGYRLGKLDKTPTDQNNLVLLNKNADDIIKKYNISVTEEVDRLAVSGNFKPQDDVKIILDNLFSKKTYNMTISKKPYTSICVDTYCEEEQTNGISITKYINNEGLSGKYYIYIKINGTVYDLNKYIIF